MSLSIILTCYNETPFIFQAYEKILSMMDLSKIEYEIVVVDDGSFADTQKQLKDYFKDRKNTTLVLSSSNEGRGGAVTKGIKASSKEYAGFIDIDLEIPVASLFTLYYAIVQTAGDIVIGRRIVLGSFNMRHLIRNLSSKAYFLFINTVLRLPFLDTETGIKIFKRNMILPVLDSVEDKRWFWDTEIIAESVKNNLKIIQEPVFVRRNINIPSHVRVFRDTFRYLRSLKRYCRK